MAQPANPVVLSLILGVGASDQLLVKESEKALGAVSHVPQCCLDDDSRARRPYPNIHCGCRDHLTKLSRVFNLWLEPSLTLPGDRSSPEIKPQEHQTPA